MNNKIKGILISKNKDLLVIDKIDFIDNLDNIYKLLNCEIMDIQNRYIHNKEYSLIIDDEGALKDNNFITAISLEQNEIIYGNILIISPNATPKGELIGLTEKERDNLLETISKNKEFLRYTIYKN